MIAYKNKMDKVKKTDNVNLILSCENIVFTTAPDIKSKNVMIYINFSTL